MVRIEPTFGGDDYGGWDMLDPGHWQAAPIAIAMYVGGGLLVLLALFVAVRCLCRCCRRGAYRHHPPGSGKVSTTYGPEPTPYAPPRQGTEENIVTKLWAFIPKMSVS